MSIGQKTETTVGVETDEIGDHLDLSSSGFQYPLEGREASPLQFTREALVEHAQRYALSLEDELLETLDDDDPVLTRLRAEEKDGIAAYLGRQGSILSHLTPEQYMTARSGGIYLAVNDSTIHAGEHQIVIPLDNGLVLKTKRDDQDLQQQTNEGTTFIRIAATPYSWENLTAEDALAEIGIKIPVSPTQYFHVGWKTYTTEDCPTVTTIEHPGSSFIHTRESTMTRPNLAMTEDLSQGGRYEVREYFDKRNRDLTNYAELASVVDESADRLLQYCKDYCREAGKTTLPGYEASFSLHAAPKGGFSLYESEARSLFFVLVDKQDPQTGTLVVGDLDGLSLKKTP